MILLPLPGFANIYSSRTQWSTNLSVLDLNCFHPSMMPYFPSSTIRRYLLLTLPICLTFCPLCVFFYTCNFSILSLIFLLSSLISLFPVFRVFPSGVLGRSPHSQYINPARTLFAFTFAIFLVISIVPSSFFLFASHCHFFSSLLIFFPLMISGGMFTFHYTPLQECFGFLKNRSKYINKRSWVLVVFTFNCNPVIKCRRKFGGPWVELAFQILLSWLLFSPLKHGGQILLTMYTVGRNVDLCAVVRSVGPVKTFTRPDGSEGQVR